ncbi:hypothetical protein NIES4103_31400 [Nostoc sp. NIES-4103]|nr:hypothetical protein NIES4103_31400 [Nostoc sp. NIES-4103]
MNTNDFQNKSDIELISIEAGRSLCALIDWLQQEMPQLQRRDATVLAGAILDLMPGMIKNSPELLNRIKTVAARRFPLKEDWLAEITALAARSEESAGK